MFRSFTTLLIAVVFIAPGVLKAQSTGDTIVVSTFNYNSGTRDTVISFPDNPSLTFEKVIMLYNMRCKDGKVSTASNRNLGCGEWDYSCNTYVVDPNHTDSVTATHPNYSIGGFSGTVYDYVTQPTYKLYQHVQQQVVVDSIIAEDTAVVGGNGSNVALPFELNPVSQKSIMLVLKDELLNAGLQSGSLAGLELTCTQNPGLAKMLRVRIKEITYDTLDASAPELSGFTEVYFANTNFVLGANRIQFHTPFNWSGSANIAVEFSLTDRNLSTAPIGIKFDGGVDTVGPTLYTNEDYAFVFNGSNYIKADQYKGVLGDTARTIEAWIKTTKGTQDIVYYGNNSSGQKYRFWINGQGQLRTEVNSGSRVGTMAVNDGQWHHVAMVQYGNSTNQISFYVDGVQDVISSTANRAINTQPNWNVHVGRSIHNKYFDGSIAQVRIWSTDLTQQEIKDWMYRAYLSTQHPQSGHLELFYNMNQPTTLQVDDASGHNRNAQVLNGAYTELIYGVDHFKNWMATTTRPHVSFFQGSYNLTVTQDTIVDSVAYQSNLVTAYQVFPKPGSGESDSIGVVSQNSYWLAVGDSLFDPTGNLVSVYPNTAAGSITISNMNYWIRTDSKFEIMSFVTPYGINLDLGMGGKTWAFDVTDYSPILKGQRRMTMERGGQWQENMDIKFLFIVGTPPRDVKDIQQIWRVDSKSYTAINSNAFFEPRDVMMNPDGSFFKIRSMITGHGQEGEFIPRQHHVKVDGNTNQWQVWKECSFNPVYPQGGTWIYDRAGWCPGMATDLVEWDITSLVTPGQTAEIDYGLSNASGTSNYIVNHQLVTYGSANHSLDVSIKEIINPTSRIEYQRVGSICTGPVIHIQNTGSTTLTSAEITYWLNGSSTPQVFNWTGSLDFMEIEEVNLPVGGLWNDLNGTSEKLYVEVDKPNGGMDDYSYNNHMSSSFTIPDVMPNNLLIRFKTNNVASQNSFEVRDEYNNVVYSQSNFTNNTFHYDTLNLADGCYTFILHDSGNNGISFWAAPNDGSGQLQFRRGSTGSLIRNFNGDFGGELRYHFTVNSPLSYEELNPVLETRIFPNPAQNRVAVELENADEAQVTLYSNTGQLMQVPSRQVENAIVMNTSTLSSGLYYIQVKVGDTVEYHKLVIL